MKLEGTNKYSNPYALINKIEIKFPMSNNLKYLHDFHKGRESTNGHES